MSVETVGEMRRSATATDLPADAIAGAKWSRAAPFPIVVGVTGHRDIEPGAIPALQNAVCHVLSGLRRRCGDALHVMTALADGADQLVAEVAWGLGVKLIAVAPMPLPDYRATVNDKDGFDRDWRRAVLQLELPMVADRADPDHAELQYEQLGALLSRRAHLLLALWDGLGSARRGGASAVVQMRIRGEYDIAGFRRSPVFAGAASRLDLSPGGPVLQIATPRDSTGGLLAVAGQQGPRAGDCFLLPPAGDPGDALPRAVSPGALYEELGRSWQPPRERRERVDRARRDFDQIVRLNRHSSRFGRVDRRIFQRQVGYLRVPGVADPPGLPGELLTELRVWQAAADTAAQSFQRRLFGWWRPAEAIRSRFASGRVYALAHWRLPPLGVLFWFTATVF